MPAGERKRPWYLVIALLGALGFGAVAAHDGWATVALYREPIDPTVAGEGISDEADRAAVVARVEAYVRAFDAAKTRGWPLGVATLLLGGATFFFAMRAMGGHGGARPLLVQLVIAQAAVGAAGHYLLRDVDQAEMRVVEAEERATFDESIPEKPRAEEMSRVAARVNHAAGPVTLALELVGAALIVLALTRRRSRDFYDAAAAAVGGER